MNKGRFAPLTLSLRSAACLAALFALLVLCGCGQEQEPATSTADDQAHERLAQSASAAPASSLPLLRVFYAGLTRGVYDPCPS